MKKLKFLVLAIATLSMLQCLITGCQQKPAVSHWWTLQDSIRIMNEIAAHRHDAEHFFRDDPNSPFYGDSTITYTGIKWFRPDIRYYFQSKLYRYEHPETVIVLGTHGEERKQLRYGYFLLNFEGNEHRLNVYKFTAHDPEQYAMYKNLLSVWFTDETTGNETYEVGRYVEIGDEAPTADHLYTINLNNAYNPYCAYSPSYSCAIPPKEDHLSFKVLAGELKYQH
jgi:uncharacterized protein (DUF1684 family)